MALQEHHIAVKFAGGIETKMDPKSVPSAKLLVLENGVFTKAISIKKRNGYVSLARVLEGSTSLLTDAQHLAARYDELLAFTPTRSYSHEPTADVWADAGACLSVVSDDRPAVRTGTEQTMPDHATNGGVRVYAWVDSRSGVRFSVTDAASGRVYLADTLLDASGTRPRCVPVGDLIHVYWASAGTIKSAVVNPTIPSAAVTAQIMVSDLDATYQNFDIVSTDRTGTPACIAWLENTTTDFRIGYVDVSGQLGSPATGHPSVLRVTPNMIVGSAIAVSYIDEQIGVSWIRTTGEVLYGFYTSPDDTTAIALAGTGITLSALNTAIRLTSAYATDGSKTLWVVAEVQDGSAYYIRSNSATVADGAGTAATIRSLRIASRAFQCGETADTFCVFVHDTTYFNTYITLRLSDYFPAGRHLPGRASDPPPDEGSNLATPFPSAHSNGGDVAVCLPYNERVTSSEGDQFTETGIRFVTLDFDDDTSHQTAQLGRSLTMGGACPLHYDGTTWTEQGFHYGPELIGTTATEDGDLTSDSTYLYIAWYEYTDNQGEVHRGPTSIGTSVTLNADQDSVEFTLPTLRVTRKANVRICVARSLPGETSRMFRITSADPSTDGNINGYVANNPLVDSVAFVDEMSDEDLQLQEPLYTNGGILSNDPSPLGHIISAGKNRLFCSDPGNENYVRFSQELAEGYGVEFPPELYVPVDPFGGSVRAVHVMDDLVIVFKDNAIFAFNGNGPLPTGSTVSSGFSAPQLLTSDVGCTNPASVVLTPKGLMFQSAKGIYLLDQSRSVVYVGAPVEAFNSQTIRRATVMEDRSQVVFLTDSGSTLLYDFLFGQWSTFTNHEGRDAVMIAGVYHYLRNDDRVFSETSGLYSDAGTRIRLRFETAWLHLWEHLQGLQRFWKLLLLGTYASPHQLGIQYRTDFEDAWTDPQWLDATGDSSSAGWITGENANEIGIDPITGSPYGEGAYGSGVFGGTDPDVYQWRHGLHVAGQSIQFRFEDFEKDGLAGASFELTEMLITVGAMHPDNRPFTGARSV